MVVCRSQLLVVRCAKAFQLLMGELGPVNNISHLVDTKLGEGKSKKVPRQILISPVQGTF